MNLFMDLIRMKSSIVEFEQHNIWLFFSKKKNV